MKRLLIISILILLYQALSAALAEETKVLRIPDSTRIIEQEAFLNVGEIKSVMLPDGITEIRSRAFAGSSIGSINLPASLSLIADDAFDSYEDTVFTVFEHSYAQSWCVGNAIEATVLPDPSYPESISFAEALPSYLEVGDTFTPNIEVSPAAARPELYWSSSNPDVVSVNPQTGKIGARAKGSATILAVSGRNPALMLSYKITVLAPEICLTMPARRTDTSKIPTTLSQIKQVRSSAYRELEALYSLGDISVAEYNSRRNIVTNAFDIYLFPWMVTEEELYWSAANSENGAKDFKPGIVYYGLPYTQTNRRYNVTTALNNGYYYDSGNGYYLLDSTKVSDRMYAGNDESSFASMAVWGAGKSHSYDSTRDIAETSVYTTVTDWDELRPGDLLNAYNQHTVIFLYWANDAHTQMVIIEQGGSEDGINTISASLRSTSYYQNKSYEIRRLAGLT